MATDSAPLLAAARLPRMGTQEASPSSILGPGWVVRATACKLQGGREQARLQPAPACLPSPRPQLCPALFKAFRSCSAAFPGCTLASSPHHRAGLGRQLGRPARETGCFLLGPVLVAPMVPNVGESGSSLLFPSPQHRTQVHLEGGRFTWSAKKPYPPPEAWGVASDVHFPQDSTHDQAYSRGFKLEGDPNQDSCCICPTPRSCPHHKGPPAPHLAWPLGAGQVQLHLERSDHDHSPHLYSGQQAHSSLI